VFNQFFEENESLAKNFVF